MQDITAVYTGGEVTVQRVETPSNGGTHFDITSEDGRKGRVDLTRDGDTEIVTSWCDGKLADLELPEWAGDVTARLARV
ncbi:hypothetical protein [Haloarcula japonica]|uniref:Uncharacterized protein n=1 Tax=Haloarcula japonica (strain ATCC 49778 / DSM 6131 / JCM 7785 / NBRC 101032 / NCIMB 13157 / TR-1) TaxID=1227453 RepID=M0LPJ1_HALJT|nr:hypothetical protein [Haloarcula japonica]EMA34389.1 hypothetical protein C444_02601 [Haloarcula japonica DSM 6131]